MKLPPFDYQAPATLGEAVQILSNGAGAAKAIAGGQSLIPIMAFRLANPSVLVDLGGIAGLNDIAIGEAGVSIGAMVRWRELEDHAGLRSACPLIPAAVGHIAHYQIRNRGTIGGSLAHADPAAEMPGIAVTCDARIDIVGRTGTRKVDAQDFFLGPLTTCLAHDEIITAIHFPPWPAARGWAFEEFSQRRGDFAFAGIALYYDERPGGIIENAHVGVIGATQIPRRLAAVEDTLDGKKFSDTIVALAATTASSSVEPDDDIHASAAYRRALVGTLVERSLITAASRGRAS
ncbi:MAG: xanthine dehydrogenase family protein subunit M [Xanthobacteraceae bacterium]